MKSFRLSLDLKNRTPCPDIHIRQGDDGTTVFEVTVTNEDQPFDFSGFSPCFECVTPNGFVIRDEGGQYGNLTVSDSMAGSLSYTVPQEVLQAEGRIYKAYFAFEKELVNGQIERVTTADFCFEVFASALNAGVPWDGVWISEVEKLKTDIENQKASLTLAMDQNMEELSTQLEVRISELTTQLEQEISALEAQSESNISQINSDVEEAKAKVAVLDEMILAADTDISILNVQAEDLSQRILAINLSTVYTKAETKQLVDAVRIGGRNYMPNGNLASGTSGFSVVTPGVIFRASPDSRFGNVLECDAYMLDNKQKLGVESGMTYTLSLWVKANVPGAKISASCNGIEGNVSVSTPVEITTEWKLWSATFLANVTQSMSTIRLFLLNNGGNPTTRTMYSFAKIKFEKGDKATDWTPTLAELGYNSAV